MSRFRLLADDLTGALDTAARFAGAFGPVPVGWADDPALPVLAIDSATREADAAAARARVAALAPALAGAELAFKKLDSLLRGPVAAEIFACARGFDAVVIAPAFPAQGRVTRGGRQFAHGVDVGVDLPAALAAEGASVTRCRPGEAMPAGISFWDAATDADLVAIAAAGRGNVLWCGTAGLAGALAPGGAPPAARLARPVVALIGSDHPVARAQVAACERRVVLATGTEDVADGAVATVALPGGIGRAAAAARVADGFATLLARLPRPGTLLVSGGETLRAVCEALDADGLVVEGEVSAGVPASRLRGGRWDGLRIVSKSGAFGGPDLLARLLQAEA